MQQTTLQAIRDEYSQALAHLGSAYRTLLQAHKDGQLAADFWAAATGSQMGKVKDLIDETHRVEAMGDPGDLGNDWPILPDLPGGIDHFAQHPISGESDHAHST